jgi:hypothetical protein
MNRLALAVFSVGLGMSGLTFAQGHGGHGKPAVTGIEHAETVANPHGVSHGIDNAEAKQAEQSKAKKSKKGKKSVKPKSNSSSK